MKLEIQRVVSQPFDENTYVVWAEGRKDALVIDPGLQPEAILEVLRSKDLEIAAILNTHGHADHIAGNAAMKEDSPDAPLFIGANETALLSDPMANLSGLFGYPLTSPPADRLVREGNVIGVATIRLEVLDVPGHSPGHVVYLCRLEPPVAFVGDVLFRGSIGRTDFPGGDGALLLDGIRNKLYVLPDETVIYPGHGEPTTIGREKSTNLFVRG